MSTFTRKSQRTGHALALAIAAVLVASPATAQTMDHSKMHHPPPAAEPVAPKPKPKPKKKAPAAPAAKPADPHAGHVMPKPVPAPTAAAKPKPVDPHAGHGMPKAAPAPKPATKPKAADPHAGHVGPKPKPAPKPIAKPEPVDPHAGHKMPMPQAVPVPPDAPVDHSTMDHSTMDDAPMDHSTMDHSTMDHSTMDHSAMDHSAMDHSAMDHSAMDHSAMDHGESAATGQPRTPIPVLTPEDRAAAFPEVAGHAAHDRSRHSFWLLDRLEANDDDGFGWKATAWVGGDIHRLWLRSEGESVDGRVEQGDLEVLGGRAISPWWDLVAGIRQDFGDGPSQTYAAVGVTGLAPYKIEIEATAYLGSSGQTAARVEASYDTLLTNRLILQWHAEADLYGKDDADRGVGAGLSTLEAGLRLRYEITRQFAPYIGVSWERAFGGTADFRRDHSDDVSEARLVAGVRVWF